MAPQAKVPKFGNWEYENEVPYTKYFDIARKGKTANRLINPNDPEENLESVEQQYPVTTRAPPGSPLLHEVVARKPLDHDRRARRTSAGSDRSFDQSPVHHKFHAKYESSPSKIRKSSSEGHGLMPNTPGRSRARLSGQAVKEAAIPKFGDWDENNPASADEFSTIFGKVGEEKQAGSAKLPSTPNRKPYHDEDSKSNDHKVQRCCCFPWLK